MATWQRRARLLIAVFAVIFALFVALAFRRRAQVELPAAIEHMEPKAVVQMTGGHHLRYKLSREDLSVNFEKEVTYTDGTSKLFGVKITTTNRSDGRTFTVTGKEGQVHDNPTSYSVHGDVMLVASDGLKARTEHASYAESDATLRAPGPVEFTRGRMSGHGVGMTYEKIRDVMTLLDQAVVHTDPDKKGAGGSHVTAGTATFARRDRFIRFEREVKIERGGEVIQADTVMAYLSEDEERVDSIELRGNSRVNAPKAAPGALRSVSGRDMNLKYAPDAEVLQHLLVVGDAVFLLAGEKGKPGRQLSATDVIDTFLAADGSTPTALAGRDRVQLTFPAEAGTAARTIRASTIDAIGEQGRGLTKAKFAGNVEYRENSATIDRSATSATLEVDLEPGMSSIDEAKFAGAVRFTDGHMSALAAAARYVLAGGVLELSGTEPAPGVVLPRVVNEQIAIDATTIAVTLVGPQMKATGTAETPVKSALQPAKKSIQKTADPKTDTKMPSMLKQDQPANVTATELQYDGTASKVTYTGNAQLWQGDTAIRADSLVIDHKTGDLTATGNVSTTVVLDQVQKDPVKGTKTKERVHSTGSAGEFKYEEATRRATYTGAAHLRGPQGDMTATKIELYLKPSGNEIDRAEAHDGLTLRESGRTTTGSHLTYFAEDERYEVAGTPVTIVDACEQETKGSTLTFNRASNTIVVDGNKKFRTQGKGNVKCPGS